jgi:hypothetical protein
MLIYLLVSYAFSAKSEMMICITYGHMACTLENFPTSVEKFTKKEYLGAPKGAQRSSFLGAMSPRSTVVLILAHRWRGISKNEMHT